MKNDLIDLLVRDFQENEGKGRPYAESMQLRAMLQGLEVQDLELLARENTLKLII